jgi:hypothetical protein
MKTYEVDGKEYEVIKPNGKQIREARKIYNRVFAAAVREGSFLRSNIRKIAEQHNIWDEDQETRLATIRAEIDKYTDILDRGGIELSEARNYAVKINSLRMEALNVLNAINDLDQLTAEGQAEDESRNYLISQCIVHKDTRKPYCINVDDLYSKTEDPVVILGIAKYTEAENKNGIDIFESLPEIKFLKEFKFMDDEYNFINENGERVDQDGKVLQENTESVERQPFLRDGKPV